VTTDDRQQRTSRLAEAAAARSADATARARRAITKLNHTGEPVTFVSIARTAGVSTSFLYQQTDIRREISEQRHRTASHSRTPTADTATVESLRTKLQVALQRNRDLAEEVAVLRTENEVLRSRVLELDRGRPSPSATA
jgi:hypothetical protein